MSVPCQVQSEDALRARSAASADRLFAGFCLASFLLAVAYGMTFLLTLLVSSRGGEAGAVGTIIGAAGLATVVAALGAGHIADAIGAARALSASALVLAASTVGFALVPDLGWDTLVCGVGLGAGWGTFYTLGPVVLAGLVAPVRRAHRFALLSGSLMTGIGASPLLGRLVQHLGLPVETAFWAAAGASVTGGLVFLGLEGVIARASAAQGTAGACRLQVRSAVQIFHTNARWPILMVGLGSAVFGGLSSFQTVYAAARGLDYSLFFLGFMAAAVIGRLALSGLVTRSDPYVMSAALTALIVASLVAFLFWVDGWASYLVAATTLGMGYGLTYSVINGLAAGEAPPEAVAQALLLFSLSYFVGLFGCPALAGRLVAASGVEALLWLTLSLALMNCGVALARLVPRVLAGAGI